MAMTAILFFYKFSSLIINILVNSIIVKLNYSSFCLGGPLKDPCGSFLDTICESLLQTADCTHHSAKCIHHLIFSDYVHLSSMTV